MRTPFGKYAGHDVSMLPVDYCRWLLDTVTFRSADLKRAVANRAAGTEFQNTNANGSVPDPTPAVDYDRIIRSWFRAQVLAHHPDRGGSHEVMVAINAAHEMLQRMFADAVASAVN